MADLVRDREVIATARNADLLAELTVATGAAGLRGACGAFRLDASDDVHLTDVAVRPREELG